MKRVVVCAAAFAAAAAVLVPSAQVSAHHPNVSGAAVCADGVWSVDWVAAPWENRPALTWSISGAHTAGPRPADESFTFARAYPLDQMSASVTVTGAWSNGASGTRTATTERPTECDPPDTTTTIPDTTSTSSTTVAPTTTAPETTSTSSVPETSSTSTSTSTPPTTGPTPTSATTAPTTSPAPTTSVAPVATTSPSSTTGPATTLIPPVSAPEATTSTSSPAPPSSSTLPSTPTPETHSPEPATPVAAPAPDGQLPNTGAGTWAIVALGAFLILPGLVLAFVARFKRNSAPEIQS